LDPRIASGVITGLAGPVISYPTLVFCGGASRAGIGRPDTLCVGAAGRASAVCCVRGGGGGGGGWGGGGGGGGGLVFREVNLAQRRRGRSLSRVPVNGL